MSGCHGNPRPPPTLTLFSFVFARGAQANSAATGAGIIWFFTYCPYFFLQLRYDSLTRADKLVSCLFSNTAMAYAAQLIGMFEGTSEGIQVRTRLAAAQ